MLREEAIMILKNEQPHCGKKALFPEEKKYEAYDVAINALEQESCEEEYIKVPKKALKYRTTGMVAYNTEWLKNHFDMERAVICGEQEPILDKIRAEIMQLDYNLESVDYDQNDMAMTEEVHMICREELLQIIDRYRVESEE